MVKAFNRVVVVGAKGATIPNTTKQTADKNTERKCLRHIDRQKQLESFTHPSLRKEQSLSYPEPRINPKCRGWLLERNLPMTAQTNVMEVVNLQIFRTSDQLV